ncbi:MAG: G8 domain-containing protein [Planctomycetia bacterium]|nr:G8 domain-containing protein [Planctomycetia bacterium]
MRFLVCLFLISGSASAAEPVLRSAKSGRWSDPATWAEGKVPGAGAKVLIRPGHRVEYDAKSDAVIRAVNIGGSLVFDPSSDTLLNVGLVKIQPGDTYSEDGFDCDAHGELGDPKGPMPELIVGTPERPIAKGKTATIRLHYVEGMNKETCPAIVCCGGRMDLHGQPMPRTWLKLGATAKAGAASIVLAEPATGWKAGDKVIVTATQTHGAKKTESKTEEATIAKVDGAAIELSAPLTMDHAGEGNYRGEVANLSRSVVVESADPAGVRGHTMYHRNSAGSISYAEFRHLGKKNVLGKYAIHFHLCRDTMRGSFLVGNSVWDSDNRWITIHGTDYLVVRDNVGYKSVGHGFFLEDGTEVYNLLDRNLAVGAKRGKPLPKQALPFDQNEGAGFWWTCSLNSFTRNVAAECGNYGFRYEATPTSALKLNFPIRQPDGTKKTLDPRTLPFVRFDDNEVHSSTGLYGVNLGEGVNRVGPDERHPFVVRNLKVWDIHYAFRPQVPNLVVENLDIHHAAYGVYHPNFDNHYYKNVSIAQTNTEPFNRGHDDLSIQYGKLVVDGLTFDGCRSGGMPLIQISDDNPTGRAETHFRNVKTVNWQDGSKQKAIVNLGGGPRPKPKTEKGVPVYLHDWFGPGRIAMVASTRSPEYLAKSEDFRAEVPLTGNESRVAEVSGVPFPAFPEIVDDLPPMTVVTQSMRRDGKLVVRGTCIDNGVVKRVTVNGMEAKFDGGSSTEWTVTLEATTTRIEAKAEDAAGNVEQTPAVMVVR